MSSLANFTATNLGSMAIRGAIASCRIDPKMIEEVFMGNVLQAACGQAPARQASLGAGLDKSTDCTTVNKG
jgi:acetyl-CoA C-acetyltransferase